LGLRVVLAKGFARIHRQNLINYGVLPLVFVDPEDYDRLRKGDVLHLRDLHRALESGKEILLECGRPIAAKHGLTEKQVDTILAGGLINWHREQRAA
jgi:aconitate hydratase